MKEQYVSGLAEGTVVDSVFVVRSRDLRAARTGDAYLSLEFSDRTGSMPGVMFRPGPDEWSVPPGSAVRVRGRVTAFRGVRRISVETLSAIAEFEPQDMIATGARRRDELVSAFDSLMAGVSHPGLRALLDAVFGAPAFRERFESSPGERQHHHAYLGGLLEHTVSVASLCRVLSARYDGIDPDLLVSAALLHDVGMVDAICCVTSLEYTDKGRLLGHVVLGEQIVSRAAESVGRALDPGTALRLTHVVTCHHDDPRYGESARPALLEAVILRQADELDASAAGFLQATASAAVMEEPWTASDNAFGRSLHVPTGGAGTGARRGIASAAR